MNDLNLEIVIDPNLPPVVEGAVTFDTGAQGTGLHVYATLLPFFEDLISGAPMPLRFAVHGISGAHTVIAATLFFSRDIALHPATPGLVYLADLAHRMGDPMLAHAPSDVARFFRGLKSLFPARLSKKEQGDRLVTAMQWVRAYVLEGSLPDLGPQSVAVQVLDVGTNGFVIAEGKASKGAWDTLFRTGHLRGFIIEPPGHVLAARKSVWATFDLEGAVPILNELENHSGGQAGWKIEGDYLASPPSGTSIPLKYLTEVFLRR